MSALPEPRLHELSELGRERPYASHYRFGRGGACVVYFGGAVTRAVYEARRLTAPTLVAEAFDAARARVGVADVDLVVVPCPLSTGADDESWVDAHHAAIRRRIGASLTPLGVVGYSAGARLAILLAALEDTERVACFGGASVSSTLFELAPVLRARAAPLQLLSLVNTGDPLGAAGPPSARDHSGSLAVETATGPGGHPFADYLVNGFVVRAFAHALGGR